MQGFMQDNKFASHAFLSGHEDINSYTCTYKPVEMCFMTWNKQETPFCKV